MKHMYHLAGLRAKIVVRSMKQFFAGSALRATVVCTAVVVFWGLMFLMFFDAFRFLDRFQQISDFLVDYLFAFFFLALLAMMTISNGVICYTSFYRAEESLFLMSLPVKVETTFLYKSVQSILFSLWGMGALVVPLFVAYGVVSEAPWYFYVVSMLVSLLFMGLPMGLGALFALVVPIVLPRHRKLVLVLGIGAAAVTATAWIMSLVGQHPDEVLTEAGLKRVVGKIEFCQHWLLPSQWVTETMLAAARGLSSRAGFMAAFVLANVLFLGLVVYRGGSILFQRAWSSVHAGSKGSSRISADNWIDRWLNRILFLLPDQLRLLVMKDLRTFRRDPSQWSQFLLFFGLLALYIVNLPRLGLADLAPFWHSLISLLNLAATCLTLSTLTSRFIFPQLSLEGRRIWVLGLMPMDRATVLWGKFVFATAGSILVSGSLIALSDLILGLEDWIVAVHMLIIVCACSGLNGLAVGLGAVFPNMRSDNPSRIVNSFGGTLNLLCSIFFILIIISLMAIPLHLRVSGVLLGDDFVRMLAICLIINIMLTLLAFVAPMRAGVQALREMEF